MIDAAPILVTTYNRFEHFRRCIESLSKNVHASVSDLYIAIDYPSRDIDFKKNEEIVDYCNNIKGFRSVEIIRRESNYGSHLNMKMAREYIFTKYDRIICSEDDNIFAESFLDFINNALSIYCERDDIFAICGYNYPVDLNSYEYDIYIHRSFCAWGFGIWRNKYYELDFNTNFFFEYYFNPVNILKTINIFSNVFCQLVDDKYNNNYITGDTSICFHSVINNKFSIHPVMSMVKNTGHDGSGIHCGVDLSGIFSNQRYESKYDIYMPSLIMECSSINRILKSYFNTSIKMKIKYILLFYLLLVNRFISKEANRFK